jgi:uncharacterized protein YmfQ (DUF2313 family)
VIRLSCELPYAVGVTKNTAQSITRCQEKAKQKGGPRQAFFREPVPQYSVLTDSSYSSLPMLPHSGQSSQLFLEANEKCSVHLTNARKSTWCFRISQQARSRYCNFITRSRLAIRGYKQPRLDCMAFAASINSCP